MIKKKKKLINRVEKSHMMVKWFGKRRGKKV